MNIKLGSVVKSKAGRDKDKFLLVVNIDDKYVYVCDGKERPLNNPKRKNPIHLQSTKETLSVQSIKSDKELKKLLKQFNSDLAEGK